MQAGVLDADAGGDRQCLDDHLVIRCELVGADLVGQVEVPVDAVVDLDRGAEERCHRWVPGWEPDAGRVVSDHPDADRPGVGDEDPEHALAGGEGTLEETHLVVGLQAADPGLPRAVPVDGQDGRARPTSTVGHQQVGRHRHVRLAVEHDPVPPVAVDRHPGVDLRPEVDRLRPRRQFRPEAGLEPVPPGGEVRQVAVRQGVGLHGGGQPGHHLEPRREIPLRSPPCGHARSSVHPVRRGPVHRGHVATPAGPAPVSGRPSRTLRWERRERWKRGERWNRWSGWTTLGR